MEAPVKPAILLIQFLLSIVFTNAQVCSPGLIEYNLKIEVIPGKAGSIDHTSFCNFEEFHFIKDCLSDFDLPGVQYRYYRVVKVTRDSMYIARPGEDDPLVCISPKEILALNTITWCNYKHSPSWFPNHFHADVYRFSIVVESSPAFGLMRNLCYDEECETVYPGYLHCDTQRICSYIFKKDGEYYEYGDNDNETRKVDLDK